MSAVPCHTVDVNETVTISSQTGEDEISDNDDFYGLTSEDEAFVPSVGENLRNSTFNIAFSSSVNVKVHGGDDLSNFESNDDAEYNPSSEGSGIDEGEGKGKSTSKVFEYNLYGKEYHAKEGDKIVLKSRQLFENVDKFKEVLRDYTIQQGCSIIRDKNEKARVTAHCVDSSYIWRIHVSLLLDVSLNGNNGLFPIAMGVVESENTDNWEFFLQNLNTVIGAHSSEVPWTFMSDQ
ncbi:hypothetical protein F0562_015334 [Nyssa sinensis]|uniref:Transposase MuDR plant domain-containing protein n=1 Tax=Nyssa sinensis TaxID=561372 RepID=A0A5J4ZKU1_9ASTE|nr:hypothetical protein F0562_015334 [Nyssa sinensis]